MYEKNPHGLYLDRFVAYKEGRWGHGAAWIRMEKGKDFFQDVWEIVIDPVLVPVMSMERIYWGYLLSSLAIALFVFYRKTHNNELFSLKRFFTYCFPKKIYLHESAKIDYRYFFVNKIFFGLLIAPGLLASGRVAKLVTQGIVTVFGTMEHDGNPTWYVFLLYTIVIALALDLALYLGHYLQHKVPLLWQFHKLHHSAEVLTPMTVYRMHPLDTMLIMVLGAMLAGISQGIFQYFFPMISVVKIMGLNLVFFLFYLIGYNLRHSHIWVNYSSFFSHIFVSPAQHQVHHSANQIHFDKNIGFIFSFWDWIFGTLHIPTDDEEETLAFGLGNGEEKEFSSVWACYTYPFKTAVKMIKVSGKKRSTRNG